MTLTCHPNLSHYLPQDTNDNAQDFVLVATDPATAGAQATLGAPGPENTSSPLQRNAHIKASLIDPQCSGFGTPGSACARVRTAQGANPQNAAFGTLLIRRKFRNTSTEAVTRLRFRVVTITTLGNTKSNEVDIRVLSSANVTVTDSNNGSAEIKGLTLEEPPLQPNGGGLNSTLAAGTITLGNRLAPNAALNVEFRLGVMRNGTFRFLVNVEAASVPVAESNQPPRPTLKSKSRGKLRTERPGRADSNRHPRAVCESVSGRLSACRSQRTGGRLTAYRTANCNPL